VKDGKPHADNGNHPNDISHDAPSPESKGSDPSRQPEPTLPREKPR
jgi:hypothetical protein